MSLGFLYDIEQRCNSRDPQKDRYSSSAPSASGAKVFDSTHLQQRVETTQLSPATSRGHGDAHGINGWTAASPFIFVRFASAQQPVSRTETVETAPLDTTLMADRDHGSTQRAHRPFRLRDHSQQIPPSLQGLYFQSLDQFKDSQHTEWKLRARG